MIIQIKDKQIEYYKFGNGTKTMVMIPGVGVSSCIPLGSAVENAYKMFKDDFTVYLIERANNLSGQDLLEDIATQYVDVFDYLKLKDIYMMGASYGGMLCQKIAATRPDLIKKMAVVSSTSIKNKEDVKVIAEWYDLTNKKQLSDLAISMIDNIYSAKIAEMLKDNTVKSVLSLKESELNNFSIQLNSIINWCGFKCLKDIKCPTFIIAAKGDKVFNYQNSEVLNCEISNSKLFLYDENFPHAVYDEALDIKNKIYDFFME